MTLEDLIEELELDTYQELLELKSYKMSKKRRQYTIVFPYLDDSWPPTKKYHKVNKIEINDKTKEIIFK